MNKKEQHHRRDPHHTYCKTSTLTQSNIMMPTRIAVTTTLPATDNSSAAQRAQNGLRSAVESLKCLVNEEFECPICLEPCTDTHTNPECLHRFCGNCINESLRKCNHECPSCRVYIPTKRTMREDKKFDHIVSEIVSCTNSIPCVDDIFLTRRIIVNSASKDR